MKEISDVRTPMFLNQDSDYSMLKPDESPYILNMEMVEGKLGTISKSQGNLAIWKTYPAGFNYIVGWCQDMENDAIIYAVYNASGNHYIVRYNSDGSFDDISASESFWNFQQTSTVSMSVLGTGNNAELLMVDGYNENRLFNIYNFENGVYSVATKGNANLIKPPPTTKVALTNNPDSTLITNNIRGKVFQVCYRYVYDDNKKSRWGFPSDTIYCEGDTIDNRLIGASLNNRIQFTFAVDYTNITGIDIAIRNCDEGSGIMGLWNLYDQIDVTGSSSYDYQFYNDKTWIAWDQSEFTYFFDDVPLKSKRGISIAEDRVALAGNTKGFDQVTVDASLEIVSETIGSQQYTYISYPEITAASNDDIIFETGHGSQRIMILAPTFSDVEYYYLISDDGMTAAEVAAYFERMLGDSAYNITLSRTDETLNITNNESHTIYFRYKYKSVNKTLSGLVSGVKRLGIVYYDYANRDSRAATSNDLIVNVDYVFVNGTNIIKYTLNHLPPSQATHYQFAISGNSIPEMFEIPIVLKASSTLTVNHATTGDYTVIDVQAALDNITNDIKGSSIKTFEYAKGDRIRFTNYYNKSYQIAFSEDIDTEILSVDSSGKITISNWNKFNSADLLNGNGAAVIGLMQVYHPSPVISDVNDIYYGIGDVIPITGGYHTASWNSDFSGSAQNQTATLPAIGLINWGDCYYMIADFYKYDSDAAYTTLQVASKNLSLLYDSEYINQGLLNIHDPKFRETYKNSICWGGLLSEVGIVYNQLNKFDPDSERTLSDKNGDICNITESGYSLNVIQRSKVTVLPIGRTEVTYSDGTTAMVGINGVFGDNNPLVENVGCIFPEAVVLNNRYVYFPDIYAGEVYRKSPNGLEPISDYGMSSYFRTTFRAMLDDGSANIVGGWDPVSKCYLLTMTSLHFEETVAFHEPTNRWTSFYSFVPTMYFRIGETKFFSTNGSTLWRHHDSSQFTCSFYGPSYSAKVWVPSNQSPKDVKRFLNIEVDSNKLWDSPVDDGIEIYGDALNYTDSDYMTYHPKMKSILPSSRFAYREGKYVASFLRDYITSSSSFKTTDLINGRQLRGKNMIVKLNSDSASNSDNILLYSVTINSSISR